MYVILAVVAVLLLLNLLGMYFLQPHITFPRPPVYAQRPGTLLSPGKNQASTRCPSASSQSDSPPSVAKAPGRCVDSGGRGNVIRGCRKYMHSRLTSSSTATTARIMYMRGLRNEKGPGPRGGSGPILFI